MAKTKSKSLRVRLVSLLKKVNTRGRWISLEDIYRRLKVSKKEAGQTAAVRGLLNRGALDGKLGAFQRNPKVRGEYRVNTKVA